MIKNVVMVFTNGLREVNMKAISMMILDMDMVVCIGMMGLIILECGSKDINGEKGNM